MTIQTPTKFKGYYIKNYMKQKIKKIVLAGRTNKYFGIKKQILYKTNSSHLVNTAIF